MFYYAFIPDVFQESNDYTMGVVICAIVLPLLQAAGALFLLHQRWQAYWAATARA
jgi:hypothetical protein